MVELQNLIKHNEFKIQQKYNRKYNTKHNRKQDRNTFVFFPSYIGVLNRIANNYNINIQSKW